MRIRSHLDPTLFVVFLHIDTRGYDAEFRTLARSLQAARGTDLGPLFNALSDREHRVFAHERYHFWQGLRLPFLHTYAVLTLRTAFLGTRELAKIQPDWRRWPHSGPTPRGFDRLDKPFYLAGNRLGQLTFGWQRPPGSEFNLIVTAKDMLECAASVFDFQASRMTVAEMSDPQQFSGWRKLRPRYLDVYDFLRQFFQSERLALRAVLPLINAAFCTSIPEHALALLTAHVWRNFVASDGKGKELLTQPEPIHWPDIFRLFLRDLPYDIPYDGIPGTLDLAETPFYYMDPERFLGLSLGPGVQHPFLGPIAQEWLKRAKDVPGLKDYLDMPGYIGNNAAHQFALAADPQLRVLRVFFEDGSDKTFAIGEGLIGPAFEDPFFSRMSASEFRGFILDTMAFYGAFRRACGVHMTEAARTCHHVACPHHADNFCNAYPLIPPSFEQCGFPSRLADWIAIQTKGGHQ